MGQLTVHRGAGGGGTNALLDGANHTDTVAQSVTRGSLIYGDSTPKWNELVIGGARKALMSDGTDVLWRYPGMVYLATATASASASVDFTLTGWTNGDFAAYRVVWSHVLPATDGVNFNVRTSTDGGSSYDAGASDYAWGNSTVSTAASVSSAGDNADSEITMTTVVMGSAAAEYCSGELMIADPSAAKYGEVWWRITCWSSGANVYLGGYGWGKRLTNADVDAIQFLMSSGNIASGEFRLYGIPDA